MARVHCVRVCACVSHRCLTLFPNLRVPAATNPDITLAAQVLLDCGQQYGTGGCTGGDDLLAYEFIAEYGITDETCYPYAGVDYAYASEKACNLTMCRRCSRFNKCDYINSTKYYADEYGTVNGTTSAGVFPMMTEIFARGPISCSMYAHSASFEDYEGGSVISDPTVYPYTTHVISLVGWGTTNNGTDYWVGRNSYGTYWGDSGWFLIERGKNTLLIESGCAWATPSGWQRNSFWSDDVLFGDGH
eukprot:TRINITY_DN5310_c0_g1_i1.p1 TRINITY_DN5310_c0_g1~~TRINITY_DN5310_c0_g1_i1.p1  ORF type:complete len:246 (+),score=20.36 TRINITY_DN5310_c0_g1_i1:30-767(+)